MQGEDFLSENNVAGQTILRLVSRGNAIVAELLRLSDNIPPPFIVPPLDKRKSVTKRPYDDIIFDFKYLKNQELYDTRIETNPELSDLDLEFRDAHIDILRRFYQLFESVYKYITDFLKYIEDMEEGVFIQQTLEAVLLNQDGQQLFAEAVYLYGIMLFLLDQRIGGEARERMLISYLRYKGHTDLPLIDEVCKLCRNTGYVPGQPKPPKYPEDYFKRFPLPATVVEMIIGRLRSDDIYSQMQCYPLPEHRSTALATQAAMLYVILYFAPQLLSSEQASMREIVDKHFADNWVISFFLGYTVDLSLEWERYPAAMTALNNTIGIPNVKILAKRHWDKIPKLQQEIQHYLTEGVLNEEFVLSSHGQLMNCLRHTNTTLRWLMLHYTTTNRKLREVITLTEIKLDGVLLLLLNVAQLEFMLKNLFQKLLDDKDDKWNESRAQGAERMSELGEYFSGDKPLTRVKKNENLQKWFVTIGDKIKDLDYHDSTAAGRKIQQLMEALKEVEQFEQIESSLQVKQFLSDTRELLAQMLKIVNIKEQYLVMMSSVADISYGFQLIDEYIPLMQERIKRDPSSTIKLRATFLKLASILDLPLVRIVQSNSPDLYSVSEFYSGKLVLFVRRVMEIIPKSMFFILNDIIELQTHKIKELPTRLEKVELKDFAQLDERNQLAKLTHGVSKFTEGILAMQTTLVGIIKVEPKQLLEEGIRKELVFKLASAMDKILIFKTGKIDEFESRLKQLASQLDGFSRSFQYIQDYVNIYGLKIWQEEFSRIVNYNVEQECNSFLKTKVYDHQSMYQSTAIPIPRFPSVDNSVNFIGRLARALLQHTNYNNTIFLDQMSAWYDKDGRELIGIRTFDLLLRSVGVFGVSGLDRLLCFMIVKELQTFVATVRKMMDKNMSKFLTDFTKELSPTSTLPTNTVKLYNTAVNYTSKLWPIFMSTTSRIGQMQLLRRQIANALNWLTKLDSNSLSLNLTVINNALISDIQQHYQNPEKPYPGEDNPLLSELTRYLETAGIHDPYTKIYITTSSLEGFPVLMFLFVASQMPKFTYNRSLKTIMAQKPKDKGSVDAIPFVVGVITLLKQFHSVYTQQFLAYLGQYVRSLINITVGGDDKGRTQDYPVEVVNILLFLEEFCRYSKMDRKVVEGYLPPYVFDQFTH